MNIKEIRNTTGLSQRSFSKMFNIPISTLQKWEQGESSPTPYIIKLIANQLPIENDNMYKIEDNNGTTAQPRPTTRSMETSKYLQSTSQQTAYRLDGGYPTRPIAAQ